MDAFSISYHFTLADGSQEIFDFQLDAKNLELVRDNSSKPFPPWTRLSFHQCPNCILSEETHVYCPLAANVADIVSRFDRLISYDQLQVAVITEERTVVQKTTAQRGMSSLMGFVSANSGCPHTAFFRPMARFHLPLANVQETICRAASMYLLSQYFLQQDGQSPEFGLEGLKKIYDELHIVNRAIAGRFRAISSSDLPANAVILLDLYTKVFPYAIEETLQGIHQLFMPFLETISPPPN